ncbi:hypothetical protein BC777_3386 [Yoonia maricola]|uniref:Uncharacterized protein n=1 Tax=Yoonia maricola TaxID=420999 RepID=A0A2M8W389_9RHOB|nr:hypothetical protein [Yoonia maricola]PJI85384.1 hypothetical protein BC777_3386 [Yoonia maricola]
MALKGTKAIVTGGRYVDAADVIAVFLAAEDVSFNIAICNDAHGGVASS